jgi:hypothetical protein
MLNVKELEKLGDDIKLIAKSVKVMGQENDQIKRQYAMGLVEDLVNRLYNDLCELKENQNV